MAPMTIEDVKAAQPAMRSDVFARIRKGESGDKINTARQKADMSWQDVDTAVGIHARDVELAKLADPYDGLQKQANDAGRAVEDHKAETRRIEKERQHAMHTLIMERGRIGAQTDQARKAQRDRQELQFVNAGVLGLEPIRLDDFALTNRGTMINVNDDDAPTWEVPLDVFNEHSARRIDLLLAAQERARAEHEAACKAWEIECDRHEQVPWLFKQLPKAMQSAIGYEPELTLPTWADVVASMAKTTKSDPDGNRIK